MYNYVTVATKEYNKIQKDVEYLLSKQKVSSDPLQINYTNKKFFNDNIICFSMIYKNNQPYEMSTVIHRNCFGNGCRILNRLLVDPDQRDKKIATQIPSTTLTMVEQQIAHIKNQFDYAFISREFNTFQFVKKFAICAENHTKNKWHWEKQKYFVCADKNSKACNQWIAWTSFRDEFTLQLEPVYN